MTDDAAAWHAGPDSAPSGATGAAHHHVSIRRGTYHDSVTLLRVTQAAAATAGIRAAQIAMATPLNTELASGLGFSVPEEAGPNDLLIAVIGEHADAVAAALDAVESALAARSAPSPSGPGGGPAPARTVRSACAAHPDAPLVLLSVPGPAVLGEALDAIDAGRHVMIFSDNVPGEDEVTLKAAAASAGVLVMGPDCGTAILGGVGLGFANVLTAQGGPRVGVVAASGTGAQHLTCLLDDAGIAVSHVIGVGGRDLSAAVGGRSTMTALRMLDADPATDHIVLISKPPDAAVAAEVRTMAASLGKSVTFLLMGPGQPDVTSAAADLAVRLGAVAPDWKQWLPSAVEPGPRRPGVLRGLYSGGTLADEAMVVAGTVLGDIRSNIPLRPDLALPPTGRGGQPALTGLGHVIVDLGDDEFTAGRPHPMIDPSVRLALLEQQAADPDVTVVLMDVVLGYAADPDPAARLAPAVRSAIASADSSDRVLSVVVALCGTSGDPQDRDAQATALVAAGASVLASNAEAARFAAGLAAGADAGGGSDDPAQATAAASGAPAGAAAPAPTLQPAARPSSAADPGTVPGVPLELSAVVCAGIDLLADALREQAVSVTTVGYRPAALATPDAAGVPDALRRVLADPRRAAANALAAQRMLSVRAQLVDVRPASEAIGLRPGEFCHAGPPITFDRASGPLRGALIGAMLFERLADDEDDAVAKLSAGRGISLQPCHDRHAVGPMAGVISPSMWLFELADESTGARSWCSLNEGLGKVLRYGAYSFEVITRLRWMTDVLGPALAVAVRAAGPVDITAIIGQMVQMGDEGHNRNRAGTLMFLREILPSLIASGLPPADIAEVARFVAGNDHFFLNLVMPAGKLMGDAAAGLPGSTVVTAMCRNGTDFGIRVSGTGDQWFTGPALYPDGLFLAGFGPDDANPDIGDSAIAETVGIGGMVMATAPAIVRFVGGSVPDALAVTGRMYEITEAENPAFAVPILEFRGAPTGIDVTRVLRTGILPQINTGMAGRVPGTGQVGAGLVTPPMDCFTAAIAGLASVV